MKIAFVLASALALAVPASASAATFDALASFNGTNPASNFAYASGGTLLIPPSGDCVSGLSGLTCLQTPAGSDGPGFYKSATDFDLGTLQIVSTALIVVPDDGAGVFFVAPTAGNYFVEAIFNSIDDLATGVTITGVKRIGGIFSFNAIGSANSIADNRSYSGTVTLGVGDFYGFSFGPGAIADNDATAFNFRVTNAVPEPETWASMLLGFLMIGAVTRRRARIARAQLA